MAMIIGIDKAWPLNYYLLYKYIIRREVMDEKKTMLGMTENLEATLCYALSWITGIIFLVLEKENKLVKFHAIQSIIVFLGITVVEIIISVIPGVRAVVNPLLGIASFILWIFLLVKTYQGEKFVVPFAGEIAGKMAD
jgi:uncharacterized membrane protein